MLHVQYWMSMSHISYLATSCQDRTLCDFTVRIIRIGTVPPVLISGFYSCDGCCSVAIASSSQIAKTYIIMYITILTLHTAYRYTKCMPQKVVYCIEHIAPFTFTSYIIVIHIASQ